MPVQSPKSQYLQGVKDAAPVILGVVPVALAYAILADQAGWNAVETISMSLFVLAGSSQIMAVGMYAYGASPITIILATFILNLRHLIMSTCVLNQIRKSPVGLKLLAAYGVTDETFALFTTADEEKRTIFYFFGLITSVCSPWIIGTIVGTVVSDFLPVILTASLGIALYAMFIGLLLPNLTHNKQLAALVILTALCNTLLSRYIASSWALILSTLICAAVGANFVDLKGEKENTDDKG